jgi:hypothetical protein
MKLNRALTFLFCLLLSLSISYPSFSTKDNVKLSGVPEGSPYNAADYGNPGDMAAIQAALTRAGSASATLYIPPATWNIAHNLTIPANITLELERGALLAIARGKTVSIKGGLDAGLYQIFSGPGAVTLSGNVKEAYPQWWGAKGDGVADDTAAILKAATAWRGTGGTVYFPNGTYLITRFDQFTANNIRIQGENRYSTVIKTTQTAVGQRAILYAFDCNGLTFNELTFDAGDGTVDYTKPYSYLHTLRFHGCNDITVRNCIFQHSASNAIDIVGCGNVNTSSRNITIEDNLFQDLWGGAVGIGAGSATSPLDYPITNVVIRSNSIINWDRIGADWDAIIMANPTHADINHNFIYSPTASSGGTQNLDAAIVMHGGYNIDITDNDIVCDVNITYSGIVLSDFQAQNMPLNKGCQMVQIANNRITGGWTYGFVITGINSDLAYTNHDLDIIGNNFYVRHQGIWLQGSVNRVNIANNLIRLQAVGAPTTFRAAGVYITPDDVNSATTTFIPANVMIAGNLFQAYAYSINYAQNAGVSINGFTSHSMNNINIQGNTFISFGCGCYENAYINTLLMTGNVINDAYWPCWNNDPSKALYVIHRNNTFNAHGTSNAALDYYAFSGPTPIGNIPPDFIGQDLLLNNRGAYSWWRSTGITKSDWVKMSN